jgi:hypothetical protein
MPSLRLQRVRELLKREVGEAIRREFEVSEAGLISVNDVDVVWRPALRPWCSSASSATRTSRKRGFSSAGNAIA